ncbi:MAG: hypothetical protein FWD73_15620 [Polyangiaceae bacterium]|nr:hypothetical protein [Polyangiaceae bacterium]
MRRFRAVVMLAGLALIRPAMAQPAQHAERHEAVSAASRREAKMFFGVGAQAYERGDFLSAIAAFGEAQRRAPNVAVTYAIAQAHRRQYYIDKNPQHLLSATSGYREYIKQAPGGPHAAKSAQYLAELGPVEERVGYGVSASAGGLQQATRLSVSTSSSAKAMVSLDGAEPVPAPLISQVTPGKHVAVVTAPGFQDERYEIVAAKNAFVAVDATLKGAPARLVVTGPAGPRVEVDGRLVGQVPLTSPVVVASGVHHIVAISQPGRDPDVREIEFGRDELKHLDVSLHTSTQRQIALGAFVGAGVLAVATVAFAGVAANRHHAAKNLLNTRDTRALDPTELSKYSSARNASTTWTTVAIGTGIGAAAVGVTGLVLYLFDDPSRSSANLGGEAPAEKPEDVKSPIDISFAPAIAPGFAGGGFAGCF